VCGLFIEQLTALNARLKSISEAVSLQGIKALTVCGFLSSSWTTAKFMLEIVP